MLFEKHSNALDVYINEFLNNPHTIEEYKLNFLKNNFYVFVENYINVKRKNLLIGASSNKKYLYFRCKLNSNLHFVYNLNNPSCNYLRFDYPIKFVEILYSDEIHYKKYKTQNKNIQNYKKKCCCVIV